MKKVRKVGTTKNKNSELIKSQSNFMKRWDVEFDNNNISSFRNRIINVLRDILPKNESLARYENDLFYNVGLVFQDPFHIYTYEFKDSLLLKYILKLDFKQPKSQVKFLWWLENILNMGYIDNAYLAEKISEALVVSGIDAQLCKSGSSYSFYPIGAELLDIKVVNDVLNWLEDYPKSREKFNQALIQFGRKNDPRHVLDNLRLSFELFLKDYLHNDKSLENQKSEVGKYLKDHNVPKEIRDLYSTLVSHYSTYNNENVKHNDNCSENEIEFIIYLTGTFIRFLIQTKSKETVEDK